MPNIRRGMRAGFTIPKFTSCLLLFAMLLLTGCSHTPTKDGPPNYYVDESKIPNAVPKVEQLSKYGNMNHYTVFGRRYYVMRSSKNYEEQGVASWYGAKFHYHHTSSGERYNMLAMTAAHKTLPLPTYVQVTNLVNGRQVIVKVNDRGPFESNRLIDLSYVAAKKLGMLGHGTARVDVKAIDPRDALRHPEMIALKHPSKPETLENIASRIHEFDTAAANQTMYVQVGAFRNKFAAEKLKKRLTALMDTQVIINPAHHLYRVKVGPFKDVASATRVGKRLKTLGLIHGEVDIT